MRVKILRTLGKNIPEPTPEESKAVAEVVDEATKENQPLIEAQVREVDDPVAHYLVRNGLAEETTEELTELPPKPKLTAAPKVAPKATPQKAAPPEHK